MSPREVAWRAGRVARDASERLDRSDRTGSLGGSGDWTDALKRFRAGADRPVLLDGDRARTLAAEHPQLMSNVVAAADRAMERRFQFFGYPAVRLDAPIDWNLDPVSGVRWPAKPAGRIDHRTAPGDVKWIWELNRLQHLPQLAQAWLITGDERYSATAFAHLDSWIAQNPPGIGIAWRGAFEAGIRAISVSTAVQGLRASPELTEQRYRSILRVLDYSARRCWSQRSRFSSANNHLVGEIAGLATIGLLFPELKRSADWVDHALPLLEQEARRQILPDGAGAEQAVGYHMFTAELLAIVVWLAESAGRPGVDDLRRAVTRSANYLAAVVGERDPDPRYGDDDEGFALRLGPEPVRTVREHLAIVGALVRDPELSRLGVPNATALWLASPSGRGDETSAVDAGPAGFVAEHGGLAVLRRDGRRLTMDIAPLGYLALAAHGHADALALTLSVDGREVIGDPGAASYYGNPDWRRVHRGTRVHATVTVDGTDQSAIGGPFMWTRHAQVLVHSADPHAGVIDAEHDGYSALPQPVVHRRWLITEPESPVTIVLDSIDGVGAHEVSTSWPLHPDLDVADLDVGFVVTAAGADVLRVIQTATLQLENWRKRGDVDSGLGWWSDRLESRRPSWLIGGRCTGSAPLVIATVFDHGIAVRELSVAVTEGRIHLRWRDDRGTHVRVVDPSRPGSIQRE